MQECIPPSLTYLQSHHHSATLPGKATKQLRTMMDVPESGVQYDLTFDINAPKILNTGAAFLTFGSARTAQWSMPSGRTTGTLTCNATVVLVDSNKLFTWYDRQWKLQLPAVPHRPHGHGFNCIYVIPRRLRSRVTSYQSRCTTVRTPDITNGQPVNLMARLGIWFKP